MIAAIFTIFAAAATFIGLAYLIALVSKDRGYQEAMRAEAEADVRIAKKQAEIIAERKEAEDVARDLDAGDF